MPADLTAGPTGTSLTTTSIMNRASSPKPLSDSRLIRFLTDLSVTDVELSHRHFAERLGQLIDLSDSITLSAAHRDLAAAAVAPQAMTSSALIEQYNQVRGSINQFIADSLASDPEQCWLLLPPLSSAAATEQSDEFEPFRRFYTTHQREMDFKLKKLRALVREALSGVSPTLSQLAALDGVIDETLGPHARKMFAGVSVLLERRFHSLKGQSATAQDALGDVENLWFAQFCVELKGLLLAELDLRLQPTLGLIEAFNEEVARVHE